MLNRTASIVALAVAITLGACAPAAQAPVELPDQSAELNAWFDVKYEESLQFSPVQLSFLGRKDLNDKIDCFTFECDQEELAWRVAATDELKDKFVYDGLSDEDQISYDLWVYQTDEAQRDHLFWRNGFVFDQMNGAQSFLPTFLMNFHEVETVDDMNAYVARILAGAAALREGIQDAKDSAAQGVHAPVFAYEGVIAQSKKIIIGAPFTEGADSSLYADIKNELGALIEAGALDADAAAKIEAEAVAALTGDFLSAYNELIAFAEADMANSPPSDEAVGVDLQPNGAAYYQHQLATNTTTQMTADEIHELGLAEVARLRGEMEAIKTEVGFEGTLQEFFTELRENKDDPRYYYDNTDEGREAYITDATDAIDSIQVQLPKYFNMLPNAGLEVKRVEAFREQDGAAQHYYPGTPDGARDGIYYAHLSDMKAMPKRELEVIAYHEGIPGHHMQISIAQELQNIPQFRTQAGFTAYVEGWALYSEWLAQEFPNTYEDPYSEFGRLGSEIWRGIRLVLDTGLHSKGWTEEQAVAYFLENAAITEMQARSEVQRYIVMPGQATSYKIGMIKIQSLRKKAEAALGDDFDIRGFHDAVLSGGALPLDVLERRVDTWIEGQQAG